MLYKPLTNLDNVMSFADEYLNEYYSELQSYGIKRAISKCIFAIISTFVLDNYKKYSEIEESNSADILKDIKQESPLVFYALLGCGIPNNTIDWIITDAIAITLKNIDKLSV